MWRFTVLTAQKPGLTGQLQDDWAATLAPAIIAASGTALRRLVLDVPPAEIVPEIASVFPKQFDSMAELWFDTRADAETALRKLAGDSTIAAAAAAVDKSRSVAWLAEVKPQKPETGGTVVKFLAGGDPALGWSVADAQKYWSETHPVVAQTVPHCWNMLTRYVQFHGQQLDPALRSWIADGRFVPLCADMGFADQSDFIRFYTDPDYLAVIRIDEQKFSRPGEMLSYVTAEERVLFAV